MWSKGVFSVGRTVVNKGKMIPWQHYSVTDVSCQLEERDLDLILN